jgi:CheY-like chemotaxis protein
MAPAEAPFRTPDFCIKLSDRIEGRLTRPAASQNRVAPLCKISSSMESCRTRTPRRILAIDDDPISLAVTAVLLEADGCSVLQAASGERALDLLTGPDASNPPDCVIADLLMPTLAGPELAARLRPLVPGARFVAMSATPPPAVEGYDAVLKKPVSPDGLRAALAAIDEPAQAAAGDAPAGPASGTLAVLDPEVFDSLDHAMSPAGLREVVATFLEDASLRVQSMRGADPETFIRQAHTIKGGAAMLGAVQVAATAAAMEAGIDHHGNRQRKLDELEDCLRRAEIILKHRLKI